MKTVTLICGLMQVAGAVGCAASSYVWQMPGVVVLMWVAGMVNAVCGVNNVLDALFGDGGLICELFPVDTDEVI